MHTFPQGGALDDCSGAPVSLEAFFLGRQGDTSLQHRLSYLLGVDRLSHRQPTGLRLGAGKGQDGCWSLVLSAPTRVTWAGGGLSKPDTCPFLMLPMQIIWGWGTLSASPANIYRGTCDVQALEMGLLVLPPPLLVGGRGLQTRSHPSLRRHGEEAVLQSPHRKIQPPPQN